MTTMRALSDQLQAEVVQTKIFGLIVTKNTGGNTLDISAGACYDPSSNKIISYAGTTALSAGSLGASQWNQVYIYDNAGTATIEVVNNAAPPATTYAGTARQGGTNSNRRWIGPFKTDGSSNIILNDVRELAGSRVQVMLLGGVVNVLSAGTSTTYAAVSLLSPVVRYAAKEMVCYCSLVNGTAAVVSEALFSVDGTNYHCVIEGYIPTTSDAAIFNNVMAIDPSVPQIYYKVLGANTPKVSVIVEGYWYDR